VQADYSEVTSHTMQDNTVMYLLSSKHYESPFSLFSTAIMGQKKKAKTDIPVHVLLQPGLDDLSTKPQDSRTI
jgi:hypothetical protein